MAVVCAEPALQPKETQAQVVEERRPARASWSGRQSLDRPSGAKAPLLEPLWNSGSEGKHVTHPFQRQTLHLYSWSGHSQHAIWLSSLDPSLGGRHIMVRHDNSRQVSVSWVAVEACSGDAHQCLLSQGTTVTQQMTGTRQCPTRSAQLRREAWTQASPKQIPGTTRLYCVPLCSCPVQS